MQTSKASSHPFKRKQQRNRVLIMTLAAASLLLISGGFYLYLRSQETGILILDGTTTLTVSLNGRQVKTQQQARGLFVPVYSGNYRLQIEKPAYQPFVTDVATEPGTISEVRPAFTMVPSLKEAVGDAVDFVQPSFDEKYVYYLGDFRQRLYRYNVAEQTSTPLTREALHGVQDVQWGNNPEVALVVQASGTYLHEVPTFDFKNQIFDRVAGPEVVSAVWDPINSDRVAAAYITPGGERSLVTADKRFTKIERLKSLEGIPNPNVSWSPDGNFLLLRGTSSTDSLNNLWLYTMASGQLTQLTTSGSIVRAVFNPTSEKVLFESAVANGLQRSVLTIADQSIVQLDSSTSNGIMAWRDANRFFEPNADGSLQLVTIGGSSTTYQVTLPNPEEITALFYVAAHKRLVFSTTSAVYSIDLETP
ncbi:hypothetical protein BH11PAT4_BH11PAT4_5940 [soil metagenome]